jgi:acyl carrier protein
MISKDEFLDQFYFIFDDLQGNSLTYNTIYKDLDEWDSLIVLSVIAHFDQKFGIIISPQSLFDNDTLDELYNSLNNK